MHLGNLLRRTLAALLIAPVLLVVATTAPARAAAAPAAPGSLTGYGFDTCSAPSQQVMDAWWQNSPYAAVGIYLGGSNRLCDQPELDAAWVRAQQRTGWHLMALWVGPQASCSGYTDTMSSDLATAKQEGRTEAGRAVGAAEELGLGGGSTLYYDLEDYDIGPDDCRRAALSFLSGWTAELHRRGYDSGVYSNLGAAITSLDFADRVSPGSYVMPDDIWFAWANGKADTKTDERVQSDRWDDHARIHQYRLDVTESYGGHALTIDANWLDVGRGSTSTRGKRLCRGVKVDRARYPTLRAGARGSAVSAAQCLLKRQGLLKRQPTGRYEAATAAGVRKLQKKLHRKPTGKLDRPAWTGLLARGSRPVLKVGATGEQVRRLQRTLTSALARPVKVDGVYTKKTAKAVRRYQGSVGLPRTGVVTKTVWKSFT